MSKEIDKIHPLEGTNSKTSKLSYLKDTFNIYLSQLADVFIPLVKTTFQVDYALGHDLELLAALFSLTQNSNESGESFRRRLLAVISTDIQGTVDGIQDFYEILTGLRPVIQEGFETRVYGSGEFKQKIGDLASFSLSFNVDLSDVSEQQRIGQDGHTIKVGHTTGIDSGGTIAAYLHDTDPNHTTNIADSLDVTTSIMLLTGGPYSPATKVDVEYQIDITESHPDFNTLAELNDNLEMFEQILDILKPAGIKTSPIQIVKFIGAFFQQHEPHILTITDTFEFPIAGSFLFNEPLPNATSGLGWGNEGWGTMKWGRPYAPIVDALSYSFTYFTKTSDAKII